MNASMMDVLVNLREATIYDAMNKDTRKCRNINAESAAKPSSATITGRHTNGYAEVKLAA